MKLFGFDLGKKKVNQNVVRSMPFLWKQNYGDALSTPTDYDALVDAYKNWVYTFANRNAINVGSTPLRMYVAKKTGGEKLLFRSKKISDKQYKEIETDSTIQGMRCVKEAAEIEELIEHPFLDTLRSVNEYMNMFELLELTDLYQEITGNSYWRIMFNDLGVPDKFWIMPAQWMRVVPDKEEFISGYKFKPWWLHEGIPLEKKEIVHFKFPNVKSVYYGLSPLSASAEAYNIDANMNKYENGIFKNGGRIEGFFTTTNNEPMTDEDYERAKKELHETFSGTDNAGSMPFLDGVKFTPFQLPPKEMSYLRGRKMTKEMLANAYGQSLGMYDENATRANSEMADYMYQRDTVKPRCIRIHEKINEKIMPLYDESVFVKFDSPVPEDKEFALKERESNLKSLLTSIDEEREKMGLPASEWGGQPIAPMGMAPLGTARGAAPEDEGSRSIKKKEVELQSEYDHDGTHDTAVDAGETDELRAAVWYKFAAKEDLHEEKLRDKIKKLFNKQRKEVLTNIKKFLKIGKGRAVTKDSIDSLLFSKDLWNKEFSEQLNGLLDNTVDGGVDFGAEQLTDMGAEFEIGRQQVDEFVDKYNVRLSKKIWPDVNDYTYEQLKKTTQDSIAADETVEELRKRIDTVFDSAVKYKSERIARTETVRAFNSGTVEGWKISQVVEGKSWLTELDDRTCFVKGTQILTTNGNKPIEKIKKDDEVYTHMGIKKVKHTDKREYNGIMRRIVLSNGKEIKCTPEHPFFDIELGWTEAGKLTLNSKLQGTQNEIINISMISNIKFFKAYNFMTGFFKKIIAAPIVLSVLMPIFTVCFETDIQIRKEKVNSKTSNSIFLNKLYSEIAKRGFYKRFKARFVANRTNMRPEATAGTILRDSYHRWPDSKFFSTMQTFFCMLWTVAFFRTMRSIFFPKKNFTACLASAEHSSCLSTGKATNIVTTGICFCHRKLFPANRTNLANPLFRIKETSCRTIFPSLFFNGTFGEIKRFTTAITNKDLPFLCRSMITKIRAIFLPFVSSFKRFAALSTNHVVLLFRYVNDYIHKCQALNVYNIEVEAAHAYYAEGALVHNCEFCVLMDGEVQELTDNFFNQGQEMQGAESSMVFDYSSIPSAPLHPGCRCSLIAVLK